jgi:UDP-glucuronate 4-epimerase
MGVSYSGADMKTILVTGGAGFIGSNLITSLLAQGNKVICVDNFSDNYDPSYKESNIAAFADNPNFSLYRTDIRNAADVQKVFAETKPQQVVHLAAKADTRLSITEPQAYIDVNLTGTLNMLESAKAFAVEKFVFASSSSVYGNHATAPFSEEAPTDFPIAPYGATKKSGEILCYSYHTNFNLPVVCLRIFNAYGERNRPDLVLYKWVDSILHGRSIELSGEGERMRDFTYIGDLVRAITLALEKPISYEIINVGNAHPISLKDLLSVVEKVTVTKAEVVKRPSNKGSVEMTHASVEKAKNVLGWEPTTSIEEGVSRLVAWFKNERMK